MHRYLFILMVCCQLTVTGCATALGTSSQDTSSQDTTQRFTNSQQQWQGLGWASYDYTVQRQCYCPVEFTRQIRVQVRDGTVASATVVNNRQPVSEQVKTSLRTIDQWFDMIARAIKRKPHKADISYHSELGYPQHINIDLRHNVADDEQRVMISDVIKH